MLTYIGGMHITPRPRKAPSRTAEPPGTRRMPAWTPARKRRTGSVSLSKNWTSRSTWVSDMSTVSPNLKPSRMPCLTHAFTRQPVGAEGSGDAARTSPADSASRSRVKTARALVRSAAVPAATSASTSAWRVNGSGRRRSASYQRRLDEAEFVEHACDLLLRVLARRAHRQAVALLDEAHRRHRRLHRHRVGFDEVDLHQRQ